MPRVPRPSPALLVAFLALTVALSGSAYAAGKIHGKDIKKNTVTSKQLKKNSVSSKQLRNNAVGSQHVKDGSLRAADLQPGLLGAKSLPRKRVVATPGASVAGARAAAPEIVLYQQGALTIYGKCFTNTAGPTTYYETYIKTSQNGAIFDSRNQSLEGGPAATDFLNTNTPETDAILEDDSVSANNASMDAQDDSDFTAFAPDGTTLRGFTGGAVKNGNLPGGNGVYGAGDVCLFSGGVFGN